MRILGEVVQMLKAVRKRKGIRQKDLALRLGISQAHLSKIENYSVYNIKVSSDIIEKIAEELNICPIAVFLYFINVHIFCRFNLKKTE
ncbi:helix-turn-helix transcriptional regulator [Clostridium sp. MB40-C1]|uniref:helix-turn-helix domain-containing protein n=1 Tax=Clostridium sp. MB40-C1 TaxID=3070996 RepID=UPI0027E06DEC|nr:helix-turn-helix transcriptional regulator [Clostridium sp. MB40-C1]WMJ79517.1 helix-turn-helix transcriptional regulator [Clostridium sp. MB40-C1]